MSNFKEPSSAVCVIDIGGTNFRSAVAADGELLADIDKKATPNFSLYGREEDLLPKIIDMILDAYNNAAAIYKNISCLAVGFPGPVNGKGEILGSSVIFGKQLNQPFNLKNELEQKMNPKAKVLVTNDLTASAWRYKGKYNSFCLITVSSGIGNKVFANGQVLVGENGIAGEIGHFSADIADLSIPCSCGWGKNHIGMISSGRGVEFFAKLFAGENGSYRSLFLGSKLSEAVNKDQERITSEMIAHYADQNDVFPQTVIDYCTKPLANAICLLALALFLEKFVIIGGFALNCRYYLESLRRHAVKKGIYNYKTADIENMIIYGENDDQHTLIGLGKMAGK